MLNCGNYDKLHSQSESELLHKLSLHKAVEKPVYLVLQEWYAFIQSSSAFLALMQTCVAFLPLDTSFLSKP